MNSVFPEPLIDPFRDARCRQEARLRLQPVEGLDNMDRLGTPRLIYVAMSGQVTRRRSEMEIRSIRWASGLIEPLRSDGAGRLGHSGRRDNETVQVPTGYVNQASLEISSPRLGKV